MEYTFGIGDRVESTRPIRTGLPAGIVGTIVDIIPGVPADIGVCWDNKIGGHNCSGHCEYGYGWYVTYHDLRLVDEDTGNAQPYDSADLFAFLGF